MRQEMCVEKTCLQNKLPVSIVWYLIIPFIAMIIYGVGSRPLDVGTDTINYATQYADLQLGVAKSLHFRPPKIIK